MNWKMFISCLTAIQVAKFGETVAKHALVLLGIITS